jgi:Tol biopolymer transport system component
MPSSFKRSRELVVGIASALAAVAILAVPALRHFREQPPPLPAPVRLTLSAPPGTELGAGDETLDAAISPDERQIVFVATSGGTAALWRRALDSERAERIAGTEGAQLPAWKQTGNAISFFAGDRLKQVSLTDGTVGDLTRAAAALGASWLVDGSVLFAADTQGPIRRLKNGAVTDATKLRPGDRSHAFPGAAGTGDGFVYTAILEDGRRSIRLVSGGSDRELVMASGHGQLVGSAVLHVRDGVLLAQRLSPETSQPTGRAMPLALDVGTASSGHSFFTASNRILASGSQVARLRQLTWFSIDDGRATATRDPGDYWQVRLSPDDRHAAVAASTPLLRTLDIVLVPMSETGHAVPLTRAVAADTDPVWSPDGRSLLFRSFQDGPARLYVRSAYDQDADDQAVPMPRMDETPTEWHRELALVQAPGEAGDFDLWTLVPSTGARDSAASSRFNETDGRLSPDGRWIAYVSDESGQPDIYAAPWPRGARTRVSFAGGTRPRWGRDSRTLFFLRGQRIMRADLSSGSGFATAQPVVDVPGIRDFDVGRRSDRLLAVMPAAGAATGSAAAIVDWQSLLR